MDVLPNDEKSLACSLIIVVALRRRAKKSSKALRVHSSEIDCLTFAAAAPLFGKINHPLPGACAFK
jgi:hypothetical protein